MSDSTNGQTSVYRYYDKYGLLLYVGITSRGAVRNAEHNSTKTWWPHVIRQEVEHFSSRPEAARRERALIHRFRPPFNTQHNPDSEALRSAYFAMQAMRSSPSTLATNRFGRNRIEMDVISSGDSAVLTAGSPVCHLTLHPDLPVMTAGAKLASIVETPGGAVRAVVNVRRGRIVGATLMYRIDSPDQYSVKRIDVEVAR